MTSVWVLVSFTLGWSTQLNSYPTAEKCYEAKAIYASHSTFMTRYECLEIAGQPVVK